MTDKAKPPQPMAFKNLAELKRYIKLGTEFKATRHKYHPDIVGLTRVVTNAERLTADAHGLPRAREKSYGDALTDLTTAKNTATTHRALRKACCKTPL